MAKSATTIKDVARLAEVSIGTVSRVVNGVAEVKPEIRKRVEKTIEELGYVPNAAAKSMRRGRTLNIACILREINIAQLGGFVSQAHDVMSQSGYSLMISNSEGKKLREIELLRSFANGQVDGILFAPYTPVEGEFEEVLRNLGVPLVMIDRDRPDWADCVTVDHAGGVRRATEHLLSLGHRRIALLTGSLNLYPGFDRKRGYLEAYRNMGLEAPADLINSESFLSETAYRQTSALLGSKEPPTAVIAGGIDMLPGVLRAVRVRDKRIGDDVSIIASGSTPLTELHQPPIATINWSQQEVGETAVGLLLDRLERGYRGEPRRVIIPTEFNPQMSCAPPAMG